MSAPNLKHRVLNPINCEMHDKHMHNVKLYDYMFKMIQYLIKETEILNTQIVRYVLRSAEDFYK